MFTKLIKFIPPFLAAILTILAASAPGFTLPSAVNPLDSRQPIGVALAQASQFDWSFPLRIAERQESRAEPTLVADQSGLVHLLWAPFSGNPSSIYYAQWDGNVWTDPVDIFADQRIGPPSAAVDSQGIIHLVWSNGSEVKYSQARTDEAFLTSKWEPALSVANGFFHSQVLVDKQDKIYVVYPGLSSSGVKMTTSSDGGYTWSPEIQVALTNSGNASADAVRAAVSDDGTIHVVWVEYQLPQGWPPLGLYYSNSSDGGESWSRPQQMAGENYNQINIATYQDDTVHLAWNGATGTGGRYHRWSQDGGATWSNLYTLFPPGVGGSDGAPQLAVDSLGTLHLLTSAYSGAWYAFFRGQNWSTPVYVATGDETGISANGQITDPTFSRIMEYPAMALNGGNRLHTVMNDERSTRQGVSYWYTTKQTSASPVAYQPFPEEESLVPEEDKASSVTPTIAVPTPHPVLNSTIPDDVPQANAAVPIVIAVLPVLLLVLLVISLRLLVLGRKN